MGIWYSVVGEPSIISESVLNNEYPVREYPSSLPVANVIYRLTSASFVVLRSLFPGPSRPCIQNPACRSEA
ncbi:hypothetical protein D3OALGB2SA_66 [Olavius algarvensis associated proteobacterium Delta 3]|nr:hypothetical protein D3OALGB2SA_66 [Olavius algarvensis associated proteobacterium Delta 3]